MKYYEYRPDANNFAGIGFEWEIDSPERKRVLGVRRIDHPVLAQWTPPIAHGFDDNPPAEGDFPSLSNYWTLPVMSQRAWDLLRPLIGYCCEALPIIHPTGEPYYIIHVMETVDALDEERSEVNRYSDGGIMRVVTYALKYNLVTGKPIFKLPKKSGGELLIDDEFRRAVEQHGLKGLLFKAVPLVGEEAYEQPRQTIPAVADTSMPRVATDRSLTAEEAEAVREQVEHAMEVLGIDPHSTTPDDIQQSIYQEVNRVRGDAAINDPETLEEIALGLGCLWGQSVCDVLGWQWAFITIDANDGIGVLSPSRSLAVFPMASIMRLLQDSQRENTSLLLYNMLKADSFSAEPNSYKVVE